MQNNVFVVLIRQNLTACDTIHRGPSTQRTISEHVFETKSEALAFYEKSKASMKFAGLAGQYATFPQFHESFQMHTHTCDHCGERFTLTENDPGFSDLPNGDFCSRACFRNAFQESHSYDDEPYFED